MSETKAHQNVYHNVPDSAKPNPHVPAPGPLDEEFTAAIYGVLSKAAELGRVLIGAHQAGVAVIVQKDWGTGHRFFSLSDKYAEWSEYAPAADGTGTHGWLLHHNKSVRYTQAELEAHADWKDFDDEKGKHPSMRGWLAAPIVFKDGTNWGLLQLSDKYVGEFTAEDEKHFALFAQLISTAVEALWDVCVLKKKLM